MPSSTTYKKIVVITSRFPYPLEKGDKLRAFHQIQQLSKEFEVHLITTSEIKVSQNSLSQLEPFCNSIQVFQIRPIQKWTGAFAALFSKKPIQVGYFYHHSIHRKIKKHLKLLQPDHIYCQLIRAAEYVKNHHNCPKTIDYMDAFSKGVERRSETAKGLQKYLFQVEFKRLLNYENSIFEYFEHHTIISEQDKNYIFHKNRQKISVVPNGVDPSYLNYQNNQEKDTDIVFTGNMAYPPNITAAQFIVNEIKPHLSPSIRIKLAGANPSKEVEQLSQDGVELTGFVDDIREAYTSAQLFVAPMFLGTGLQNKLLEAMALGIPCITTSMANNALHAKPEKEILIADSAEDFVEQINRLLQNSEFREEIIKNGRQFILQNYNWDHVTEPLIELIQN